MTERILIHRVSNIFCERNDRSRSLHIVKTIPFLLVFDKGWPTSDFKWFPSLRVVLNNLFFDKILLQTKRFRPASRRERGGGSALYTGEGKVS